MGKPTGAKVLGREIFPGDEVMNEWTGQVMTVEEVRLKPGAEVKLICVKPDGRREIIEGNWDSTTRLVTRKVAQFEDEDPTRKTTVGYVTVRPRIGGPCPRCGSTLQATYEPYECRCSQCGFWWDSCAGKELGVYG